MRHKTLVEICVDDTAGLAAAVEGGADRVELCAALAIGGITPSTGFMRHAATCGIPANAMIRPRGGDFVYSPAEIDCMLYDIDAVREAGLNGVVFGVSRADGRLDSRMLERLCTRARGLELTLHRAFDVVPDFAEAVEQAVALGFSRILTSGGQPTAPEAVHALQEIVSLAAGRISIMPGSGVRAENARALVEQLGVHEIHSSCAVPIEDSGVEKLATLGFNGGRRATASQVQAFVEAVNG